MPPPSLPPLLLPPPYHSLRRISLRRLAAAHALAATSGQLSHPHSFLLLLRSYAKLLSPLPFALLLFRSSRRLSIPPNPHSLPLAISAASSHLPFALSLHALALSHGLLAAAPHTSNALISLYSKNSLLAAARQVFDEMRAPDVVSYNTLMHAYAKSGRVCLARQLFDGMPERDAVSWGTLISGCARLGRWGEAVELFDRMGEEGVKPDDVTLAAVLSCCTQLGALEKGRAMHEHIRQSRVRPNVYLCTGLVDLYAKCGCIGVAREVFEACPERNVFTWNALVVGLAMHGHGTMALEYFVRMRVEGVRPDGVTFLGVLIGCSHAGLVDMARRFFVEMESMYGVARELKHYGCMADLLGRAGLIKEAMEMIERMPMEGDEYVWGGVLAGCRMHGNVEVAEVAARHLLELNPEDSGVYSVMAGIYADAGRWEDVARIRKLMDERGCRRNVGCSSIQAD